MGTGLVCFNIFKTQRAAFVYIDVHRLFGVERGYKMDSNTRPNTILCCTPEMKAIYKEEGGRMMKEQFKEGERGNEKKPITDHLLIDAAKNSIIHSRNRTTAIYLKIFIYYIQNFIY